MTLRTKNTALRFTVVWPEKYHKRSPDKTGRSQTTFFRHFVCANEAHFSLPRRTPASLKQNFICFRARRSSQGSGGVRVDEAQNPGQAERKLLRPIRAFRASNTHQKRVEMQCEEVRTPSRERSKIVITDFQSAQPASRAKKVALKQSPPGVEHASKKG